MKTANGMYRSVAMALSLVLAGCPSGDDDGGGGSSSGGVTSVTSSQSARSLANDLVRVSRNARGQLTNGTYTNQVVKGPVSGTASVTGNIFFQSGISCGANCVRSENKTGVTIVYSSYAIHTASNTTTTVSGSIQYTDTTFSQQSGLNFSSGGTVSMVGGTAVSYELIGTSGSTTFGTRDTLMSFSSSGTGDSDQHGTLVTAGGTFNF